MNIQFTIDFNPLDHPWVFWPTVVVMYVLIGVAYARILAAIWPQMKEDNYYGHSLEELAMFWPIDIGFTILFVLLVSVILVVVGPFHLLIRGWKRDGKP